MIRIHITGPQGSDKSTIGLMLKNYLEYLGKQVVRFDAGEFDQHTFDQHTDVIICESNAPRRKLKDCAASVLDIFLGRCHDEDQPMLAAMEHALDILDESGKPEIPPAIGVGRVLDQPKAMMLHFDRALTDDEMRELHEHLAHRS